MKKFYLLLLLFITTSVMAQTPIITMVLSGECAGGVPKVVEIYAHGTVDFTLYTLENQTNANTTWGAPTDLSALGVVTDEFVYIHSGGPEFATQFPSATNVLIHTGSTMSINGDDRLRIIETGSTTVIDQFGEDGVDGSGKDWEYVKGYVKRNDNTGPNGSSFDMTEWTAHNEALIGSCGTPDLYEALTNAGSFVFASTSTSTITTSALTVSGFLQILGIPSPEKTFNVSGVNLTADVMVTVSNGDYEIALTSGGTYGASVTVPFGTGTIAATPVYIRLNGAALANPSNGMLTLSSAGATDVQVNLEGIINSTSSLNDNDFIGVSVYPNPLKEVLNITNENGTLESVEVISTAGSVVYASSVSSSNFTINTANLNAGVYFVNVRTENSVKTFKVIK